MSSTFPIRSALAILALSLTRLEGQELRKEVEVGDTVAGIGKVTSLQPNIPFFRGSVVSNAGDVLLLATTDVNDPERNDVLLQNGSLRWLEGDPHPDGPSGTGMGHFVSFAFDRQGTISEGIVLDTQQGFGTGAAVYWNDRLVVRDGDLSSAPEFTPGTYWETFIFARGNTAGQLWVLGRVREGASGTPLRALVRFQLDAQGVPQSEQGIVAEGDTVGGLPVIELPVWKDFYDFNPQGDAAFTARVDTGQASHEFAIFLNDNLIAVEGAASPVAGRRFEDLETPIAINAAGEHAFQARLDGDPADDEILIRNGSVAAREGDPVAGRPQFQYEAFHGADLDDAGKLFYLADWNDTDPARDEGFVYENQLVLQEGVTSFQGARFELLSHNRAQLSANGRYAVFYADLDDGRRGIYRLDVASALSLELQPPLPGLAGQPNTLTAQYAQPSATVVFYGALKPGQVSIPCQNLSVSLGLAQPRNLGSATADAAGVASRTIPVPNKVAGRTVYLQCLDLLDCAASMRVEFSFP